MKLSATCKRYLISAAIGAGISLLILLLRGSFYKEAPIERYRDFSDAFFVSGFLLAGIGGLIFVSENGVFDMIRYGVSKAVSMIRSEKHRKSIPKSYYDYIDEKTRKARAKYGFLLITGSIYLVVSVLFAFL